MRFINFFCHQVNKTIYQNIFLLLFIFLHCTLLIHAEADEKSKKNKKPTISHKERKELRKKLEHSTINKEYRNEFEMINCLFDGYDLEDDAMILLCEINLQTMQLFTIDTYIDCYSISTSEKGIGNTDGSFQTPIGMHKIYKRICNNCAEGTIIRGLTESDKKIKAKTDLTEVKGDYLTTRVLTLEGMDKGINKGGIFDSHKRGVMIHGTPEEGYIGQTKSKGCVRMYNDEIIRLFSTIKDTQDVYLFILE